MIFFYRLMRWATIQEYRLAISRREMITKQWWDGLDSIDRHRKRKEAITAEISALLTEIDGWSLLIKSTTEKATAWREYA